MAQPTTSFEFSSPTFLGTLQSDGAVFIAHEMGDGLAYSFAPGMLQNFAWISADFLVEGNHLSVFQLRLQEGESGPRFELLFGFVNQCSARLRMPLEAVQHNRWRYEREGAWLKPIVAGQRVDLAKVDRLELVITRKSEMPTRFAMTPLVASFDEPGKLSALELPVGPLLDEFGQSTIHEWPAKTVGEEELLVRLQTQHALALEQKWPSHFSRWGGDARHELEATGWFRAEHDGNRWWLVDPDGHPFWSTGMDCVAPHIDTPFEGIESALSWLPPRDGAFADAYGRGESFNYLAANFIRAFGVEKWRAAWGETALGHLRAWGFNTVANWSDWRMAKAAGFPYVRPLDGHLPTTPLIYRDFPDVFDDAFPRDAAAFALQLAETRDDPAFIGYFLMNEPTWGFAQQTPAEGMMLNTQGDAARRAFANWLREKYGTSEAFSGAWGVDDFELIESGPWTREFTPEAQSDLAEFSSILVERFFDTLSQACREVDPHHMNLGVRYYTVPPQWCLAGMKTFDVFSMNCYNERIPADKISQIAQLLKMPVLIGEWHFGALDVGLPASGIGRVATQEDRGRAFRVYTETAAAHPACVGVHYFTLYDQSATGRFDGENYNIGFLDVCNRPYEPLADAALRAHENVYAVARGDQAPYEDAPQYLTKIFI